MTTLPSLIARKFTLVIWTALFAGGVSLFAIGATAERRVASIASGTDNAEAKTSQGNPSGAAAGTAESTEPSYIKPPTVSTQENASAVAVESVNDPIRIQLTGEPSSLDPARLIDQYSVTIMRNVVQGLFKLDDKGKLTSGLADWHEVSADGLKYRFRLKKNAKWSDGRAVTIEDFIYGLRRVVDPKVASADADSFLAIARAREIFFAKAPLDSLGVKRVGDELHIELSRPDPAFLMELALPAAGPLRKDIIEANKGKWTHKHPVTGDYMVAAINADSVELQPNPQIRRRGQRPIIFKLVQEGAEALKQLENGSLDILTRIPLNSINETRTKGLLRTFPSTTIFYLSFNMAKPPFNKREWRRAIATVIDRRLIEEKLEGTFKAVSSYLPRELDGALPYSPVRDNKAVALVKKAIAQGKLGKSPIRFAWANSEATGVMAEVVREELKQKLGIEMEAEPTDLKNLLVRLSKEPPDLYILGKTANFNDAITHLSAFSNIPDVNYSRYRSAEYEKLIDEIRLNPSSAKRIDLARRANLILVDRDVVLVPLMLRFQTFGISPRIKGFKVSPYQVIQLSALRK